MRNLKTKDLFTIAKIINKAKIKEKIKDIGLSDSATDIELYVSLFFEAIVSVPDAEKEIYEFLADIAGVKPKEIENDEFELLPKIIEHLKGQENLVNFFKQAFKFVN